MPDPTHTLEQIFPAVAAATGVGRHFLRSDGRSAMIVHARTVAALAMRDAGMSWPQIGRAMHRSHSSVLELVRDHGREHQVQSDLAAVRDRLNLSETQHAQNPQGARR